MSSPPSRKAGALFSEAELLLLILGTYLGILIPKHPALAAVTNLKSIPLLSLLNSFISLLLNGFIFISLSASTLPESFLGINGT